MAAEPVDQLAVVDHHDHAACSAGYDLLPQQRAAQPLDEVERAALDLVGAVNDEIELGMLVETGQRQTEIARELRRPRGRWDADDSQAARGQELDGNLGR